MIGKLEDYRELASKCSFCSLCEAVCPVYREDLLETHVARARIDLINKAMIQKTMPLTKRGREIIDRCLVCTSCTQSCGAFVPVHEIIISARHELYKGRRHNFMKRYFVKRMMDNRGIRGLTAFLMNVAGTLGLLPRDFPGVARRPFDRRYRGTFTPEGGRRARVAYYVGCATNTMDPETGVSVMKVLARNGVEVVVPEGLTCCGIPALAEGDIETARRMSMNNAEILSSLDVDAVVTDCTSCAMMLRTESVNTFADDDPSKEKIKALSDKVWEVTDYLNSLGLSVTPSAWDVRYTYHVPCHSGFTKTINEAPLDLLANITGAEYRPMDDPGKCCGAGGAFYTEHPDLSRKIRDRKMRDISGTGAGTIVTQCPSCRMYLAVSMDNTKEVIHPLTMLRRAYGL